MKGKHALKNLACSDLFSLDFSTLVGNKFSSLWDKNKAKTYTHRDYLERL